MKPLGFCWLFVLTDRVGAVLLHGVEDRVDRSGNPAGKPSAEGLPLGGGDSQPLGRSTRRCGWKVIPNNS